MTADMTHLDPEELTARIIERLRITATATYGAREIPDDFRDFDPWTVVLRRGDTKQRMTVPFYMGQGHNGKEPTADEVLYCLLSDAAGYEAEAGNFSGWCSQYGYDKDSRKAYATFQKVQSQTRRLKQFLGDYYEYALWGEGDPDEDDK